MRKLIAILAAAGLTGCSNDGTLPRWNHVSWTTDNNPQPLLQVSSAPAPAADPLTIRTLSDHAGGAYVKALDHEGLSPAEIRAAMAEVMKPAPGDVDQTRIGRVLTIAVQRPNVRPGDRFLMTEVQVTPANFAFADYQSAATEYNTINIGSVTVTGEASASAQYSPPFLPGAGATLGYKLTKGSTRNISDRQQLSVNAQPYLIDVVRSGGEGIDLTGNTLVKISFDTEGSLDKQPGAVSNPSSQPLDETLTFSLASPVLRDAKTDAVLPMEQAKISLRRIKRPAPHDLYVCARMFFADRQIAAGRRFYDESRHDAAIHQGWTQWQPHLVAPAAEYLRPLWTIQYNDPGGPLALPLQFDNGLGISTLVFDDYDSAQSFVSWLRRYGQGRSRLRLANGELFWITTNRGEHLPFRDLGGLQVVSYGPAPDWHGVAASKAPDSPDCEVLNARLPGLHGQLDGQGERSFDPPPKERPSSY